MATLTVQTAVVTGVQPTFNSAAGGGDVFANDGNTYAHFVNGSGGSITVTFDAVPTSVNKEGFGDITISDTAVAIPAGEQRVIGPFPQARFNNSSGQVSMTYSGVTSLTVATIKLPRPQ